MPRPDLAKLVADNLDKLPHPDGSVIRFLHYSTFGQTPTTASRIKGTCQRVGDAIANLAEINRYTISHPGDPKPSTTPGTTAKIHCQACGALVLELVLDDNRQAAVPKTALEAMARHEC